MSKLETNTIDTISGSTTLTLGGTNATNIAIDSAATLTGFKSTGIDDNATSTAVTIDSNENVGINTTSPDHKVTITGSSSQGTLGLYSSGTSNELRFENDGNQNWVISNQTQGLRFKTAGTDRMRIESDGALETYANNSGTLVRSFHVKPYNEITGSYDGVQIGTDSLRSFIQTFRQTTATSAHIKINNTNGEIGSITTNGTSTAFNTTSDYRLKENVNYNFDATSRLKQLKPARFNFIADANTTVDGFIAHEVQAVVPEAIIGTKDATETKEKVVINSDGQIIAQGIEQSDWETGKIADEYGITKYPNDSTWEATKVVPIYQGIDQSKLVPLLVKTIQELEARITQLENA